MPGQVPGVASAADVPISHRDRVYAAEQFSNTVSVIDPVSNTLLGVIRLGDPSPMNFSPLYKGQVLVHGMGFSPDHKTLAVVSIGSNSVTFIATAANAVMHTTYVGRAPHEAFFTPDGKEVWVTVRGENYVDVLDGTTFEEKTRITTHNGLGMQIFSPDGTLGYVCSSFSPEVAIVTVADHRIVARVKQASAFCPNIAATPDGTHVLFTLKDSGKTQVFAAKPPFAVLKVLDTGPITNHVNIVRNAHGQFAYVTVGGLNEVQVFRTIDFRKVATIQVGKLPHGIWPSGDGTRVYVGAGERRPHDCNRHAHQHGYWQRSDRSGTAGHCLCSGCGARRRRHPGVDATRYRRAGNPFHDGPARPKSRGKSTYQHHAFDQGLLQVLEASATGLVPKHPYLLALSNSADGSAPLEALSNFMTKSAGGAIVNAIGPIRQVVQGSPDRSRRYLVIAPGTAAAPGKPVQIQSR